MRDVLKTERLTLRQIELTDAPAFSALATDIDVARMTGSFPHPFPLLSVEFKILSLQSQKRRGLAHPYAITETERDALIGVADLFRRTADGPWEIGYWVGRPYWGRGYMTEACRALLTELETRHGAQDVTAGVFTDNLGSMRVLEKLGFEKSSAPDLFFSMARLAKAESQPFLRPAGARRLAMSAVER